MLSCSKKNCTPPLPRATRRHLGKFLQETLPRRMLERRGAAAGRASGRHLASRRAQRGRRCPQNARWPRRRRGGPSAELGLLQRPRLWAPSSGPSVFLLCAESCRPRAPPAPCASRAREGTSGRGARPLAGPPSSRAVAVESSFGGGRARGLLP